MQYQQFYIWVTEVQAYIQVWCAESRVPEKKSAKSPDEGMTSGHQTMNERTTNFSGHEDDALRYIGMLD